MRKEYDFSKGKRGAIVPPSPRKTRITIRIDTKSLNWFRQRVHEAGGGSYQTMINDALKEFIDRHNAYKIIVSDSIGKNIIKTTMSISENVSFIKERALPQVLYKTEVNKYDTIIEKEKDGKYPIAA